MKQILFFFLLAFSVQALAQDGKQAETQPQRVKSQKKSKGKENGKTAETDMSIWQNKTDDSKPGITASASYDKLYKQVEQYDNEGLPKSAISVLDVILEKAEHDRDFAECVNALKLKAEREMDLSPDSIMPFVERMEALFDAPIVANAADAKPRQAILHAILVSVYADVRNSRYNWGNDEFREQCREKEKTHTLAALSDMEPLAGVDAKPYGRLFTSCEDSRLYKNDVLSLILDFVMRYGVDSFHFEHPQERQVEYLRRAHQLYSQLSMGDAALLTQMRIWEIQSRMDSRKGRISKDERKQNLKRAYEDNAGLEAAADACKAYYGLATFNTNMERLAFIREARQRFAGSPYLKELEEMEKSLFDKSASVDVESHIVADKPFKIQVIHRNVREVEVKVEDGQGKSVFHQTVVSEGYVKSPDYVEDQKIDTLTLSLQPGLYTVTALSENKREVTRQFRVSSLQLISCLLPGETERMVYVVNAVTGEPVQGCKVTLIENSYAGGTLKEVLSDTTYTTDHNGIAKVSAQERWVKAFAQASPEDISNAVSLQDRRGRYDNERRNEYYRIFTDRAVYRPGQTIYVTGYAYTQLQDEVEVVSGKALKFVLKDANWQEVGSVEVSTDEMGMASAEFVIPKGRLNGVWHILFGDEREQVRVEEYKRPTFDVEFDKQEKTVAFGDTAKVTGVAKTYFGVPVQGAKVQVKVQRRQGDFWAWWRPAANWENVDDLELLTDDDGRFTADVVLDGDRAGEEDDVWSSGVMVYKVSAIVTDQAGESHEQYTTLPVSAREFDIKIEADGQIDRDEPADILVKALNISRNAVDATGEWLLVRRTPTANGNFEETDTCRTGTFRAGTPITIPELNSLPLGEYVIIVKTTDSKGNKYTCRHWFVLYSTKGGEILLRSDWSWCKDHELAEGKGIDIYYAVSAKQPFVYAYLVSDKKVERRRIEHIDNTIQRLHVDFDPAFKDGLTFFLTYVRDDRQHVLSQSFTYVKPEKQLDVRWTTFRDKLRPGQDETWTISIRDKKGNPVKAQVLATMYDASLDAIQPHDWSFWLSFSRSAPNVYAYCSESGIFMPALHLKFPSTLVSSYSRCYNSLTPFSHYGRTSRLTVFADTRMAKNTVMKDSAPMMVAVEEATEADMAPAADVPTSEAKDVPADGQEQTEELAQMRTDFAETAFFYPNLMTDADGEVKLMFRLPESLTKWQFMAFAHTQDVDYGLLKATAVAAKDFMVQPNMPRFARTGDKLTITARIINQCENSITGKATMKLINPDSEEVVFTQTREFSAEAQKTTSATFDYQVGDDYNMLICEISATDGNSSDGERNWLPVLSDKKLITEAVPFYMQGEGVKTVDISTLFNNNSPTAKNRKMTFEFTDNPAWNVVLTLHGMATPTNDNAIEWAAALYVNSVARHLAAKMPRLQNLLRQWEREEGTETTMQSELEKNQQLKDILLQESPWMLDAKDETEQRHQIAELFNQNLIQQRISTAKDKLRQLQLSGGAWTWFKGMLPSYYTTFAVCDHLSMLQHYFRGVGETLDQDVERMLQAGLSYLDGEELKAYEQEKKWLAESKTKKKDKPLPGNSSLHYIYMAAVSQHKRSEKVEVMVNDYLDRVQTRVNDFTMYGRANCAVALLANGSERQADAFVRSLREYTVTKPLMGRYFDTERAQYSWCDYRMPTHVAAMAAMAATREDFSDADQYLNDMQVWILRQKQGQKWDNVINSIKAVDILLTVSPETTFHQEQLPQVKVGDDRLTLDGMTAGVGFARQVVGDDIVSRVMSVASPEITVEKLTPGLSWGTVYGQSLETLDKVEQTGESLTVSRLMYVYDVSAEGDGWRQVDDSYVFKVGDKVRMRHIIMTDQDLDFVQVRSQHAACLEPLKTRSGYQMLGGRGGYLALHDASADFFFDRFAKGTVTIDLEMYVTSTGSYSNGIATAQCAYAPAFSAHSSGSRINVK